MNLCVQFIVKHCYMNCISGGRSRRSFPIVTFPECSESSSVTDKQHRNVVKYLTSIPEYVMYTVNTHLRWPVSNTSAL